VLGQLSGAGHPNRVLIVLLQQDLDVQLHLGVVEAIDSLHEYRKDLGFLVDRDQDGVHGQLSVVECGYLLVSDLDFLLPSQTTVEQTQLVHREGKVGECRHDCEESGGSHGRYRGAQHRQHQGAHQQTLLRAIQHLAGRVVGHAR